MSPRAGTNACRGPRGKCFRICGRFARPDTLSLTERQALLFSTPCDKMRSTVANGAKPSFASTTVGLAVGVTAAVVLACAGGAYLYSQHHMQSLLENARATALAEGDLIRVAREHQMIENDRTLIAKMIESFRRP